MVLKPKVILIEHIEDHQETKWKALMDTDPARVVRVLAIRPGNSQTPEGDDKCDLHAVAPLLQILAVEAQYNQEPDSKASQRWAALVEHGLTEGLCSLMISLPGGCLPLAEPGILSSKLRTKTITFYPLLQILLMQIAKFSSPLTMTDNRMLTGLKSKWQSLTNHIYRTTQSTAEGLGLFHVSNHDVIPRLALLLLSKDLSFIDLLDDTDDHTLNLAVRDWLYSTDEDGLKQTTSLITEMIEPSLHGVIQHRTEHNGPRQRTTFFRFFEAISLASGRDIYHCFDEFLSRITVHLSRLKGSALHEQLDFLTLMAGTAESLGEFSLHSAICKSEDFWQVLCATIQESSELLEKDAIHKCITCLALQIAFHTLRLCDDTRVADDLPKLINSWNQAKLYDHLDACVSAILTLKEGPELLAKFSLRFISKIEYLSADMLRLLRRQFPRMRLIHTLWTHHNGGKLTKRQTKVPNTVSVADLTLLWEGKLPPSTADPLWTQVAYQSWIALQATIVDTHECHRRGCSNAGGSMCSGCKCVRYCDAECQQMDWDEHKLLCKRMDCVTAIAIRWTKPNERCGDNSPKY